MTLLLRTVCGDEDTARQSSSLAEDLLIDDGSIDSVVKSTPDIDTKYLTRSSQRQWQSRFGDCHDPLRNCVVV